MITRSSIGNPVEVIVDVWSEEFINPDYVASAISALHDRAGRPDKPFGVYFLDGLDPRSAIARIIELERFQESFDNDTAFLRDLYQRYELAGVTEFCCVVDHENLRAAGEIRMIRNSRRFGSRTMDDLVHDGPNGWGLNPDEVWRRANLAARDPDEIVDCATMAVSRAYQSFENVDGVSRALSAGIFNRALEEDVHTMVCAFEKIPAMLLQSYTGGSFNAFEGVDAQPYYGAEETLPMWVNHRDYEYWIRTSRPDLYAKFVLLEGLDKYHFAWPHGPLTWRTVDLEQVVDLRQYVPDESVR